jgi:mannitol/fructose-specific phosphotransferase system IIA component (Ntr-type)
MTLPDLSMNAPLQLDLDAATEHDAIAETAAPLDGSKSVVDCGPFLQAVFDRQRINPPVLGCGIALPHARTALVREIVCAASRCREPVLFGPEETPVRLIFLFGIPPDRIGEYLALTAALVKRLRNPEVLAGLMSAETAVDFRRWLA